MRVISKISKDYDCNTYLIPELKLIIDPGLSSKKFWLLEHKFKQSDIEKVILTHCHYDHIATANDYENAQIFGSKNCVKHCKNADKEQLAHLYNSKPLKINCNSIPERIDNLEIIDTPGHSDSCICIFDKENLFSGDLFFKDAIGRIFFSTKEMLNSLEKIKKLRFKTLYPGHFDLGYENSITKALNMWNYFYKGGQLL